MNEFEASAVLWTNLLMGAGVAADRAGPRIGQWRAPQEQPLYQ